MKYKITKRLVLYFGTVLLLFSFVIGILFIFLFTRHTTRIHQEELLKRATTISNTLSEFRGQNSSCGNGGGYGAYLRFLDDIAMSEVWLVDKNADLVNIGHNKNTISYSELPTNTELLIEDIFKGETVYSKEFSSMLGTPSVTAGAPVFNEEKEVVIAVLLHASIKGLDHAVIDGFSILGLSLLIAFMLAAGLSVVLSMKFIYPLKKMEQAASTLIDGDYTIRTGMKQEDEIGSLADKIDILAKRLEDASKESIKLEQLRKDFISNISHELRTPVTVIRGSLEALYDEIITDPHEVQEYYKQMLSDTIHLQRLVNDLLELSRLENTDFAIEMSEVNFVHVVEDAVRSIRCIAKEKEVDILIQKQLPQFYMMGDYGRLRQMIIIILDNAVKFSYKGTNVQVLITEEEQNCIVSIINYGQGIPREDIPYIFERFYYTKTKQNCTGSGLGLAIAKQIAQRHNIIIQCESQQENKTVFTFII